MQSQVVDRETAEAEVNQWLESKKVFPSTIDANRDNIDVLIEAIMYGVLVFDQEQKTLKHKLLFPLGEDGSQITELTYKNRLNDRVLQKYTKGMDQKDIGERVNATLAAITDQSRGIIAGLDTIDKKVAQAIGAFFF